MDIGSGLLIIVTVSGLMIANIASPGPNFVIVSRMAASGSRKGALAVVLGIALGSQVYAILTLAGVAVLLQQIGWLARLVQILGGTYLLFLGWRGISAKHKVLEVGHDAEETSPLQGLRIGLMVAFTNFKAIAFFIGLFAAAVPVEGPLWVKLSILVMLSVLQIGWYGCVALLLSQPKPRAVYARFRVGFERVMGSVLALYGLKMIAGR